MSFQQMDVHNCAYIFKVWLYLYAISFYIDRIKILFYRFGRKWTSFGMNIISGILCIVVAVLQRKGIYEGRSICNENIPVYPKVLYLHTS